STSDKALTPGNSLLSPRTANKASSSYTAIKTSETPQSLACRTSFLKPELHLNRSRLRFRFSYG
ncbi:MAG: hypothetical protein LBT62_00445, partial [Deltaproteobacteria bacterium]|nr:hypothetical protein [Deltaproteobacteria bacterium]